MSLFLDEDVLREIETWRGLDKVIIVIVTTQVNSSIRVYAEIETGSAVMTKLIIGKTNRHASNESTHRSIARSIGSV